MRKSYRVKSEADFQRVFDQHHSVANKMFIVYTMEREQAKHFRLGISISKKVALRGHERVWIKRRIRQSVLDFKPRLRQDVDILVIARPSAYEQDMETIKKNIEHVFTLADLFVDDSSTTEN
ncbi:ribonuclease P protein component [Weissella tructae]|jgi:ribonuclease P protein component|uniref:Ribonuclease P protein component n=2 Tax=Weissella TaxID=46255 RepID=A0A075U1Z2_9LACO|nr:MULTISPECIES: ribonuclease P protein component [Weissella]AIG66208.1 Ribonuclease P protein component [Weissella tructae]AIM63590.1 Ribonuclease P protein component [Weissella ceti]AIM64926.1 Ribonuclease P protein component [Weissella ceti]ELA07578.1 ribonuclease P [Weissella ceti NC36]QVV91353.1 ribonuclease P protein component [Weissella tructae]